MLEAAFAERYPLKTEGCLALRERAVALCRQHLALGLGDGNAEQRLCSKDDHTYWQQFSEVLVVDQLAKAGLRPLHADAGPDFLVEHGGRRIWIEAICPTPVGIPADWFTHEDFKVHSVPHEAMLLRWTSAIKEKSEKLIGPRDRPELGYLAKGVVARDDVYVIAINGRLLRDVFPNLEGISQFPFAVEATFCVGPYAVTVNRQTMKAVGGGHQHRPLIPKPNGANIPADTFLDPRFTPISAVWAIDADENLLFEKPQPMAVVHNPQAANPLPVGLLPALSEFVATSEGDSYLLERRDGNAKS